MLLDVNYDNCEDMYIGDGIDEMWYILERDGWNWHIAENVSTIRYYFAESDPETGCTWIPAGKTESVAEEIKTAYASSMEKWNNVYFYSYNADGSVSKNKIINVVEGTANNHNLVIYPSTNLNNNSAIATTGVLGDPVMSSIDTIIHAHYNNWQMYVDIDYFYVGGEYSLSTYVSFIRQAVGAHELGHVLGLKDVDYENICNSDSNNDHHHEVLMGYGSPLTSRASDITYKDIAGVAITRGFHSDSDHKWLNMGWQTNGTYKLVCSVCNGVKNTASLNGYSYNTYGICDGEHDLSDGNMMAVASYGDKDYYKCKYCRYVAPFDDIVTQNYVKSNESNYLHKCVNNVEGLEYTFYEKHNLVDSRCSDCGCLHLHVYDEYEYINKISHRSFCGCGKAGTISAHYVNGEDLDGDGYAPCGGCGHLLYLLDDDYEGIMSTTQVSVNGSYILPNGIVVLVDEDVEAYLAGTLQFYHPDDLPVTE